MNLDVATFPRPKLALLCTEPLRAAMEFCSHKLQAKSPPATGDGHPVIIFPGLATDGHAVAPLRKHCEALGYAARDWGKGYNTGPDADLDSWLSGLASDVAKLISAHDKPATLIGWSLGGIYARELGKLLAPRVRQVITIGTPFNGDAGSTNVGWLFDLLSGSSPKVDPALRRRLSTPPPLPTTSLYSRSDGVVAWQSCLHGTRSARVEDIEIPGSHIGMGWNPAVLRVVADRLAQKPGNWRPYKPA